MLDSAESRKISQLMRDAAVKRDKSIQKALQMAGAAGMAELAEGLGLDLADTLAGDVELLTHLLKSAGAAVVETEAELDDVLLAGSQGVKLALDDLAEDGLGGGVGGGGGVPAEGAAQSA